MCRGVKRAVAAGKCLSVFGCGLMSLLLAIGMLAAAGCRSGGDSFDLDTALTPPVVLPGMGMYSTNELHEGDVVSITFQYSTNFDSIQKIALDGMVNLEMVGPVKAAGRTLVELQQDLSVKYKPLTKDDVITVKLISSAVSVYVAGAVIRPGLVEMSRPLTALEAIMEAGGFDNSRAKLSAVSVLRIENGRQQAYPVNLKKVLDGRDKLPFYLKPFDIVYVPTKTFNY